MHVPKMQQQVLCNIGANLTGKSLELTGRERKPEGY